MVPLQTFLNNLTVTNVVISLENKECIILKIVTYLIYALTFKT